MCRYLSSAASGLGLDLRRASILDVGTGNGSLLGDLRHWGFGGVLVGVDYAASAIELARRVASSNCDGGSDDAVMRFEVWDLMDSSLPSWLPEGGFDVVVDKGTFDAISLSGSAGVDGKRIAESYREKIEILLKPGGWVLLTSCNWTEAELEAMFSGPGSELEVFGRISHATFAFGGAVGQAISSVCFRKNEKEETSP